MEKNAIYPRVAEIVMNYTEADDKYFDKLKINLLRTKKYSNLFIQVSSQRVENPALFG